MNIFEGSATSSEWWGPHARFLPISQVTTNLSWQIRPSRIPPWIRSHRELRIILSVRESHKMSGEHHVSILMTMRQITSSSYFPLVKSEKVLSENFYTIYFRQTQRRRLSHGVRNKTIMVHITQKWQWVWNDPNHYLLELVMWTCCLSFYFMFLYNEYHHADVILPPPPA